MYKIEFEWKYFARIEKCHTECAVVCQSKKKTLKKCIETNYLQIE